MRNFIDNVVKIAKNKKQLKDLPRYIEDFYSQNNLSDFENYTQENMATYAKQSFEFFESNNSLEYKIKIDDVDLSSQGHTVLDIVNKDCPFLVDSIVASIEGNGYDILNIMHPIFYVKRNVDGNLEGFKSLKNDSFKDVESVIQIHLKDKLSDSEKKNLTSKLKEVLVNLAIVVEDWHKIIDQVHKSQNQICLKEPRDLKEVKSFISWLVEKGFIFLGFIEFDYKKDQNKQYQLIETNNSPPLGVFRSKNKDFRPRIATNSTHEEIAYAIENPYVIEILKSSYKSKIHRLVNAERIRIQKFAANGDVIGEYRVIGLFTSSAYYQRPTSIPLLKEKITKVIERSGYSERSHNHKELLSVLQHYPRDELFQIDNDDLLRISTGIVMICGRNQIRVFGRCDKFNRFINCLVFMPKGISNPQIMDKIKGHIAAFYNGSVVDFYIEITESSLVRLQVIIKIDEKITDLKEGLLEKEIIQLAKPWSYLLKDEIYRSISDDDRRALYKKYSDSFGISYINRFSPQKALKDIKLVEEVLKNDKVVFDFSIEQDAGSNINELKMLNPKKELYLSEVMPVLESFGLNVINEHTYVIKPKGDSEIRLNYFRIFLNQADKIDNSLKEKFEDALDQVWSKNLGRGSLNKLLLAAHLDWRLISLVKSYSKYLFQTGLRLDQDAISEIMVKNIVIVKLLIELFQVKFDPAIKLTVEKRVEESQKIITAIKVKLEHVSNVDHDDLIRRFYHVINATIRTNFYQTDEKGQFKNYVSFKFDCAKIPELPLPKPYAEVFVHSNSMEGVHLRGGKVARGGIRWSDRRSDFRTEVLGLMKAQMAKNAVIVPVGSKGGFVIKDDTSGMDRDQFIAKGQECYKQFLRGILDITDNIVNGKVVVPVDVVRHDENDPYLVVAADKGTATFSDIANSVSEEYDFWLGDAFASGGSVGYDHKKMGITAKGAWVCVTRHFKEMGTDCQKEEFTCAGIGDMSGDVFGNGLLCSKATKLVAAFNHLHIFIDPNPDAKKSYAERSRLFELSRSSWTDYDSSLISKGGGIFERSAKSIKLTKEIKEFLSLEEDNIAPNDLIKAILKAKVDLLWNGGIGTYVKSALESDVQVGDRANDSLRINAEELQCKVIGEGGNLGFTQLGRIEYALNGGKINTDAMDNSAGVDCSDHEVNIKIALASAVEKNKITIEKRNKVLESMTDEVSDLVLRDNFLQSQAVSNALNCGPVYSTVYANYISNLESKGLLNRDIEFLPSRKEIKKRQVEKIGFTRPELCVMLSYAKMEIYKEILESELVNDPYLEKELIDYFPKAMKKNFLSEIEGHSLRKEIIATQITNFVVNYTGICFTNQVSQETGYNISAVVKAILITVDSFKLKDIWQEISDISSPVNHEVQAEMFSSVNRLMERSVLWLLKNNINGDLETIVKRFKEISGNLLSILPDVMAQDSKDAYELKIKDLEFKSVTSKSLVKKLASMNPVASAFDISEIAISTKYDLKTIARIYFEVGTKFSLKWLRGQLSNIAPDNQWDRASVKTITEDLYSLQMKISHNIVNRICDKKGACKINSVSQWIESAGFSMNRYENLIADVKSSAIEDISVFVVILNRLKFITDEEF